MKKLFSMLLGFLATAALTAVIGLPLAARAVTFTDATHIDDGDTTYEGHPITVDGCTLTIDGAHTFTNLYLVNNATLTHTAGAAGMMLSVSGTVWVATGSKIDVNHCGDGPRAETSIYAGGSYGGRGNYYMGESCATYGDYWKPAELGSGGRGAWGNTRGGGSGIHIQADLLSGGGSIQANGGKGGWSGGQTGGGGRVAVYYGAVSGFDLSAIQCRGLAGGCC